jgi:hypothetical protein
MLINANQEILKDDLSQEISLTPEFLFERKNNNSFVEINEKLECKL